MTMSPEAERRYKGYKKAESQRDQPRMFFVMPELQLDEGCPFSPSR
jgi:hypothetical protein